MRLPRALVVVTACFVMPAMTASAAADEHPTNPTNPVVSTTGSFPADSEALGEATEITTENPDQGPFTCVFEVVGSFDDAGGAARLTDVNITQPGSVECSAIFDAFEFPWPAQVCLEPRGDGNYTAWLHVDVRDVATWFGDYGGPVWFSLFPSQMMLPVGPFAGAYIDDSIPAFTPGDGPMHWLGGFSIDTLGEDVTADLASGSCS
jgi:hypothetical protein